MKNKKRSAVDKAEMERIKGLFEENLRLGGSKDYALGYQQGVKDTKRRFRL